MWVMQWVVDSFFKSFQNLPATGPGALFGDAIVLSNMHSIWREIITVKTIYFCMFPNILFMSYMQMMFFPFYFLLYTLPHTFTLKIP